jgi:anti-sigma regulatory factor (Ser/Thr protein kinase)
LEGPRAGRSVLIGAADRRRGLKARWHLCHNQRFPRNSALLLNGNLGELERLTAETAQFCREHTLGDDVEFDLDLVLEELFTNSVRHGGCGGVERVAEVRLAMLPDGVGLEYADQGTPFDPTAAPAPDLSAPLEERRAGGLGIHLMRQIMRDFEYRRCNGWNRIRMRRPIPAEEPKG